MNVKRYLFWLGKPAIVREEEIESLKKGINSFDNMLGVFWEGVGGYLEVCLGGFWRVVGGVLRSKHLFGAFYHMFCSVLLQLGV